jgi:hypothetical protein
VGTGLLLLARYLARHPLYIRGAVLSYDRDSRKELPIAGVEITVPGGSAISMAYSDASGFFSIPIPLQDRVRRRLPVSLRFRHPLYQSLVLSAVAPDKLCIARLNPLSSASPAPGSASEVKISNVVVKYSIRTTTTLNVGSAVKVFQVANTGNAPCKRPGPCSPDGAWQASAGSVTIDAGAGNEFRNGRASCIAGPCPFTRIEVHSPGNSQTLRVSALDWSDTATFLLEAEVYRAMSSDAGRQSYPVVFDRALTFTLPAAAEGVSIQAELDGAAIVFPLGPSLFLSWADCQVEINKDQTRVFRCQLKAGFRFS